MKKKAIGSVKNVPLTSEEQDMYDAIERGEFKEIPNMQQEKVRIIKIFKEAAKKDKRVNIRVNSQDLTDIREKAAQNRLPYQTLISTILHHFAKGKIRIEL